MGLEMFAGDMRADGSWIGPGPWDMGDQTRILALEGLQWEAYVPYHILSRPSTFRALFIL